MNETTLHADDFYPEFVCGACAKRAGGVIPEGHLATFHIGTCDICKTTDISVTEPRDYLYPDFSMITKIYEPWIDRTIIKNGKK